MDKGTPRMTPQKEADAYEHDVDVIRNDLDRLVGELDRRRHEMFDVKLQLRRHAVPLAVTGATIVGVVGGLITLSVLWARHKRKPLTKARRFRAALARMIDNPDRVAKETPNPLLKILTAAGTTVASVIAKRLAVRFLEQPRAAAY